MAVLKSSDKDIDIVSLKFPDTVRIRPGKLVGDTNNPDVILREAIDNAKDEAFGSSMCTKIYIDLKSGRSGGYYVVADNGRGIPISIDKETGKTKADLAISTLDTGSKFSKNGVDEISTGTHGVGVSCTNALSKDFVLLSWVNKDNYSKSIQKVKWKNFNSNDGDEIFYYVYYQKGIKKEEGADTKENLVSKFGFNFPDGMHTVVAFIPDDTIFDDVVASYSKKNLAYTRVVLDKFYNKSVEITVDGKIVDDSFTPYRFEFIKKIEIPDDVKGKKSAVYYVNFDVDKDLNKGEITGSVNSLIVDKGTHINQVRSAFVDSLRDYFGVTHSNTLNGLYLNVIVVSPEVDYNSQIKTNCVNISRITLREALKFLCPEFKKIFKANQEYFQDHVDRLDELNKSITKMSAIQKVKELVTTMEGRRVQSKIPKSVIDCSSRDTKSNELFIVEGKSASGILIRARDPRRHAIIELRGVPMNAIDADLEKLMSNKEMESIIKAYGGGVNELYNPDTVRYGKVIIAADADADGGRIASLILGMFAKKITRSIEDGNIYIAVSPLYIQGDKYIYPTDNINKELNKNKPFTRIKGLGELNEKQAKKIFFDDDTRRLFKVTLDGVDDALKLLTLSSRRKELMINKGILKDRYDVGII